MNEAEAWERIAEASVARLATVTPEGRPHLVPIVFAVTEGTIVSAVDHKPKRSTALQRLANIDANPRVSVLVDHYDDDWSRLWWVRADGTATVSENDEAADLLVAKYPAYRERRPDGPVITVSVDRITGWSFSGSPTRG